MHSQCIDIMIYGASLYDDMIYTASNAGQHSSTVFWMLCCSGVRFRPPNLFNNQGFLGQPESVVKCTVSTFTGNLTISL